MESRAPRPGTTRNGAAASRKEALGPGWAGPEGRTSWRGHSIQAVGGHLGGSWELAQTDCACCLAACATRCSPAPGTSLSGSQGRAPEAGLRAEATEAGGLGLSAEGPRRVPPRPPLLSLAPWCSLKAVPESQGLAFAFAGPWWAAVPVPLGAGQPPCLVEEDQGPEGGEQEAPRREKLEQAPALADPSRAAPSATARSRPTRAGQQRWTPGAGREALPLQRWVTCLPGLETPHTSLRRQPQRKQGQSQVPSPGAAQPFPS